MTLGGYRLDQSEDYDLWLRFDEHYGVAALAEPCHPLPAPSGAVLRDRARAAGARLPLRAGGGDQAAGAESRTRSTGWSDWTRPCLRASGIPRERLDETIVSDAVNWAATLTRVGRDEDAAALLDAAAAVNGAPRRERARTSGARPDSQARRYATDGIGEAARELAAYARGR